MTSLESHSSLVQCFACFIFVKQGHFTSISLIIYVNYFEP